MILPLFPLGTVLFPGGCLPLKIFEPRYMDMASACLKSGSPFGICLIAEGREAGAAAKPHVTGTLAEITAWDVPQLGILHITATGRQRFRVLKHWHESNNLVCAEVVLLKDDTPMPVPEKFAPLVPLLRAVIDELGDAANSPAQPHRFDDAHWIGLRFAELLPIPASARQTLLEVDSGLDRLEIVYRFLESKSLLPDGEVSSH
jgi:Lon protease-like protein